MAASLVERMAPPQTLCDWVKTFRTKKVQMKRKVRCGGSSSLRVCAILSRALITAEKELRQKQQERSSRWLEIQNQFLKSCQEENNEICNDVINHEHDPSHQQHNYSYTNHKHYYSHNSNNRSDDALFKMDVVVGNENVMRHNNNNYDGDNNYNNSVHDYEKSLDDLMNRLQNSNSYMHSQPCYVRS